MMRSKDRFLQSLAVLRERCPTIVPVRVRRTDLQGDLLGASRALYCQETGALLHFDVFVKKSLSRELQVRVLMHEWAHCLAWAPEHETVEDHDEMWGLAYARVYRELE